MMLAALSPASVSTCSNIPGPGRTMDKLLSFLGRRLEGLLSSAGDRMGLGTSRIMRKIGPRSSTLFHCVRCGHWMYSYPMYFGRTLGGELFSVDVINWIFQATCKECRPKHIHELSQDDRLCRRLIKVLLRSKNIVSLHQTITYVATLLSLHPNFNATFSAQGLSSALESLYDRWGRYRDTDPLFSVDSHSSKRRIWHLPTAHGRMVAR
ncbi:hypothetical protein OE88DRAFT_341099 [Heliocybe sulcata]|uniref:Uncharacterized protein n=1 Tax=Heliocybe sulcata TaxID=5364 RepID=A0A5C3MZ83_9AGAM|nr:hypothetical protein OE88DRAFT_341099 [Heliocybe sulcata]